MIMKTLILLILVVWINCKSRLRMKQKKMKVKTRMDKTENTDKIDGSLTPQVPRGILLNNHYGANPFYNSYGPNPKLVEQEAFIRNGDGSVVRKHIRRILRLTTQESNSKGCDISQKEWYYACMNLKSCDLCTASAHCGWCEITNQCLPQHLGKIACQGQCINGWNIYYNSCKGELKSGAFKNWALQTDHVQTVNYSYPKYKLQTIYTAPQVVRTPVVLGNIESNRTIERSNVDKRDVVKMDEQIVKKPIYGEILQVLPVDVYYTQYVDEHNGTRVDDNVDSNIGYHGTNDDINIPDDGLTYTEIVPRLGKFSKKRL